MQRRGVGGRGAAVQGQRRNVPRTADDGDRLVAVLERLAQRTPHVRLALLLRHRRDESLAGGRDRLGNRFEGRCAVAAVLDDVLPPAFGVGIARGRGEIADRIGRGGLLKRWGLTPAFQVGS